MRRCGTCRWWNRKAGLGMTLKLRRETGSLIWRVRLCEARSIYPWRWSVCERWEPRAEGREEEG